MLLLSAAGMVLQNPSTIHTLQFPCLFSFLSDHLKLCCTVVVAVVVNCFVLVFVPIPTTQEKTCSIVNGPSIESILLFILFEYEHPTMYACIQRNDFDFIAWTDMPDDVRR